LHEGVLFFLKSAFYLPLLARFPSAVCTIFDRDQQDEFFSKDDLILS